MNSYQFHTPILFLAYNRPKETEVVFNKIRKQKPKKLYVALDGPKQNVKTDYTNCKKVQKIVTNIDWECDLETLIREQNIGIKKAVSEAITWFFSNEEEGIILEDDCVPSSSFFRYCEDLLEFYREDDRIMMISGFNKREKWKSQSEDYFYSHFGGIWGWATWRRAWDKYDIKMEKIEKVLSNKSLRSLLGNATGKIREEQLFSVLKGQVETWDYQWEYSRHINHGLSIVPTKNLITNIGFGNNATNTKKNHKYSIRNYDLSFPLKKNDIMIPDRKYDDLYFDKLKLPARILYKINRLLG